MMESQQCYFVTNIISYWSYHGLSGTLTIGINGGKIGSMLSPSCCYLNYSKALFSVLLSKMYELLSISQMLFILASIGFVPLFLKYICLQGRIRKCIGDTCFTVCKGHDSAIIQIHNNVVGGDWSHFIEPPFLFDFNKGSTKM